MSPKPRFLPSRFHGLELHLAGMTLRYASARDFEFAIGPRADLPAGQLRRVLALDAAQRHASAQRLRRLERAVIDALAVSSHEPAAAWRKLECLYTEAEADIGGWGPLLWALRDARPTEQYLQIALVNVLRYLTSTLAALDSLAGVPAHTRAPAGQAQRETGTSRVSPLPPGSAAARLPRDRTTLLRVPEDGMIALVISRHPCTIYAGPRASFTMRGEEPRPLARGPNLIGRDSSCDIVLPARYRDVSRRHLLVDLGTTASVALTDLSAHGSYLMAPMRPERMCE